MVLWRDGNVGIIVSKCKGGAAAAAVLVHVSERWWAARFFSLLESDKSMIIDRNQETFVKLCGFRGGRRSWGMKGLCLCLGIYNS